MKSLRCILVLVVGLLWTVHAPPAGADPSNPTRLAATGATLVRQDLALAPDGQLVIQFHPAEPLGTNTVSILAYRPIALRDTLKQAIAHRLTGFVDRVDAEPSTLTPDADGTITVTVPTETSGDTTTALLLPDPGLYPIAVRVLDPSGDTLDELITFVARQPAAGLPPAAVVSVAVLGSVTAPPNVPGRQTPLPIDVSAEVSTLAAYSPDVHLSLSISPEILARLDPATLDALRTALSNSVVLSQPLVPFDPSTATASGLQDRFRQLLVDGDNTVAGTGLAPPTRAVWYAPSGITDAGAQLLREAGVRLLVVPSETYLAATGNIGALTDYSQLFNSVFSSDATRPADDEQTCDSTAVVCMPTAVIDPLMSSRLSDPSLSPEQAAMYTAADIVVYREQFADSVASNNRHALVLGPNGEGVADATRVNRAVQMVGATDAVRFVTLDQLEQSSSSLIIDGRPVELHLPAPQPADLTGRARSLNEVALAATTVSSMLVDDNGRTARWTSTMNTLYSTAISDEQVTASIRDLNAQLAAIRQCIVAPRSDTFTLTGRSTNLPLQIGNTCGEQLYVLVRLNAAADKMEFPDPTPQKLIEPLATGIIQIPVTARTNGTFDVTLDLLTPVGEAEITDSVTLKARVNTLTGLPQLITGAGLLILLTWWVRNLRRGRRQRRSLSS